MKKTLLIILLLLSACSIGGRINAAPNVAGIVYLQDFKSLQAAVDAVPNGGTVIVARGIWEGNAVIPAEKYVHIQGVSPALIGQSPPLGHEQWDWLLENYPDNFLNGSILRGHIIATANSSKLSMTNIIMIGHGEGTGVELGYPYSYGGVFENVSIGNYETGLSAKDIYTLTINRMQLAGVGVGLDIQGNLVRLRDVDIIVCDLGANLRGHISWDGGSVQACGEGVRMWSANASMSGVWFEQNDGLALTWDGYGGMLAPNFYATDGGNVLVNGYNNTLDLGWVLTAELSSVSQSNLVTISGGTVIDNGWNNKVTK
jgi:hypothetical protein